MTHGVNKKHLDSAIILAGCIVAAGSFFAGGGLFSGRAPSPMIRAGRGRTIDSMPSPSRQPREVSANLSKGSAAPVIYSCAPVCPPPEESAISRNLYRASPPAQVGSSVFEITAYCSCELCCGKWADGITASGHAIQPGDKFCAADPSIPFGTMLDIPGYGKVPVLDRGGAIRGNKLDLYFDTHEAALQWGRKHLKVSQL